MGGGWRDVERQGDSRERIKKGIAKSKGDGEGEKGRGGREEVRWGVNTGVRARKEKEVRAPCWGWGGGRNTSITCAKFSQCKFPDYLHIC